MKEIWGHWVVIVCEAITLIITIFWYRNTREYEPLAGIVTSAGALISSLLVRVSNKENKHKENAVKINGDDNIVIQDFTNSQSPK